MAALDICLRQVVEHLEQPLWQQNMLLYIEAPHPFPFPFIENPTLYSSAITLYQTKKGLAIDGLRWT